MTIPYLKDPSSCMAKLDRLPWTDGFCFSAFGARLGVRVSDSRVFPEVKSLMPPGAQFDEPADLDTIISFQVGGPGNDPRLKRFHLVYGGVVRWGRTHDLDEALHLVETTTQFYVAKRARDRIFIHAGVVAWNGRAILLPGRSFAGKSTLVAALLRAGAEYYSDEYAVLDQDGYVHAYPRRLSLRDGTEIARIRLAAEDLGSRTGIKPIPVGTVAVAQFREGARWNPRQIPASKAALALFDNAVAAQIVPEQCLKAIRQVVMSSKCLVGQRGEADETAERLLSACA